MGIPDSISSRLLTLRPSITWRGFTVTNNFHFLAERPLDRDDLPQVAAGYFHWATTFQPFLGTPAFIYPSNAGAGELLAMACVARAGFPLISYRTQFALVLEHEDPVVPGVGTCILFEWFPNISGRGHTGWSFLGPVSQRVLSSGGVGLMTEDTRRAATELWSTLPVYCQTWLPDTQLRMVLRHTRPIPNSDDPSGWFDYLLGGFVPDRRLRSLSRRNQIVQHEPVVP